MESTSSPGADRRTNAPAPPPVRLAGPDEPHRPGGAGPASDGRFLAGRTALVTGAASGIGRACAVALASAGAHVLVVDIAGDGAEEVAALIGGTGVRADLADPEQVDALAVDGVDIVVNNAGLQHVAPVHEFPPDRFTLIQRVMLEAPFRILRRTLPGMYARGWGRVVNISSVHGVRASPYKSAYVAAKHGLEGLSKVVALEGAPHGVTSNCVNPGYVRTPLVEGQIADQARAHGIPPDEVLEKVLLERSAVKRLIEPEEVGAAVLWLCGPHTGSVSGASLPMDGAWTAR
ncbi:MULTISPECIES: 3-hydroxybutyrate dehydrogenase [Streptomyces]|uniref:3-hydroxybutyrate dehydrogenase n=1 Tax=Streptomyces TaxID=1883 RepID=UPI00081B6177|nr:MULTISPECIES: 3-hydroxybutyrate dehydrogenase [unclassified Streptomyces]MYQ54045.1 3-hydroxybutyrate dehydrogenase [Streptomyces sp. SID4941]SCE17199.1 3-hydroxybutyrate dehydrogenase [Streptomyces sp. PalvLS-984]SDD12661.1 3-hydroxybutyrate dehydrogenase [Streptomyces sp. AmelKG-A3]